jgi:hypothetical protein
MSTISYRFIEHFYSQFNYKTYLRQNLRNRGFTVTFLSRFNYFALVLRFAALLPVSDSTFLNLTIKRVVSCVVLISMILGPYYRLMRSLRPRSLPSKYLPVHPSYCNPTLYSLVTGSGGK